MASKQEKKTIELNQVQTIIKKRIDTLEKQSNRFLYESINEEDSWLDELADNSPDYLPNNTIIDESNIIAIKELKTLLNQINKLG